MTVLERIRQKVANRESLTHGERAVKMAMDITKYKPEENQKEFFEGAIAIALEKADAVGMTEEDIKTLKNAHWER